MSGINSAPEVAWICIPEARTTLEPLVGHALFKIEMKLTILKGKIVLKDAQQKRTSPKTTTTR